MEFSMGICHECEDNDSPSLCRCLAGCRCADCECADAARFAQLRVLIQGRVLPLPQHANRRLPENRPGKPPPAPGTEITVTAPDWDLGELQRGKEATQTFATDAQRLCFAYDAKYIEYDKYLISVSSRNGVADNKFLLVSAADGSETVPYTLSFTGAARRWRCQYQWTAVDVGQERADVPDAHVQDMGWRHDQGRRFQRCAYVHHHNPT